MRLFLSFLCVAFLLASVSVYADAPRVMSFQGKLTNPSGVPQVGDFQMTFRLYDAATGGHLLLEDIRAAVTVDNEGLYNVEIDIPETITFEIPVWLGVEIQHDGEMAPRYRLTSSPYAFWAMNSGKLQGNTIVDLDARYVNEGQVNSITSAMIVDGTILNVDISPSANIDPTKIKGIAWTSLNDGSGSGLDADLLDGKHASDFIGIDQDYGRKGVAADLYEGNLTLTERYVNEGQPDAITTGMIKNGEVTTLDLADLSVTNAKLAANAVTTDKIRDGDVRNEDLANLSVSTGKLQDLSVTTPKIADNAVTSGKIADLTIVDADVSTTADIDPSKIKGGAWTSLNDGSGSGLDADLLDGMQSGNASGNIPVSNTVLNTDLNADMLDGKHANEFFDVGDDWGRSGVASDLYEGTTTLTDKYVNEGQTDAITTGMIKDGEVGNGDLGDLSVSTGKLQDGSVTAVKLADGAVTSVKIADGTIMDVDISGSANISASKINDGAGSGLDADLLDGRQSGNASGEIPISNTTLSVDLNADMVDGRHWSDFEGSDWGRQNVTNNLYEGSQTLTERYVNEGQVDAIYGTMIKDGEVKTEDIADGTITGDDIGADAIGSTHVRTDAVGSSEIMSGAVGTDELADNSVTSPKIRNGEIVDEDVSGSADIAPSKIYGGAWTSLNDGSGSGMDADMLDGKHATDFFGSGDDWGRSGVASDLYESTTTLTNKYVNEGQADAITSGMIKNGEVKTDDVEDLAVTNAKLAGDAVTTDKISDGTIVDADISATANISASKINDGAGSGLDADMLDGIQSGNVSGNIPISNGTLSVDLNSDMLDGKHASDFFGTGDDWGRSGVASDLYEGTSTLTDRYVNEGQANSITSGMIVDETIGASDIGTDAVGSSEIATGAVGSDEIAGDAVTTGKIADATILFGDINQNGAAADQVIKWNGSAWVAANDETEDGDWTISGSDMYSAVSGNVGIGTVTPSEKLEVYGNLRVSGKAAIGPGCTNTGANAFVAGYYNTASGDSATVGGGSHNTASGCLATVGGGSSNTASGWCAAAGGGTGNAASGVSAVVGGGFYNTASNGYSATVGGGEYNVAGYHWATVGGGRGNAATNYMATVGGGIVNRASGEGATVGGGSSNIASGDYSAILGGRDNSITETGDYSYLFGIGSTLTADSTLMVDMPHIRFGDEASGYEFPTSDGSNGQVMVTDGSGQLSWSSSGPSDGDWTISGSDMYSAVSGNVGIGTTTPGYRLHVNGNARIENDLIVGAGDLKLSSNHYVGTQSTNLQMKFTDYEILFLTNPTWGDPGIERMRIDRNGNVGVGTASPSARLDVDGNIHASGTITSGSSITLDGSTDRITASSGLISFDNENLVTTGKASIGPGCSNTGNNAFAAGEDNNASGNNAAVGGGVKNTASGYQAVVAGGANNAAGWYSAVGGGTYNTASAFYTTVSGGTYSTASGEAATVGGGMNNTASGPRATVSGGEANNATGDGTTVGGGTGNVASGARATVSGGFYNTAGGDYAALVGGIGNKATGDLASLGGGELNTASGTGAAVVGGDINTAGGAWSIVGGGRYNSASGEYSAILGGYGDTITSAGDHSYLFGIGSKLTAGSTFMVDMPHIRFGDEASGYEFPTTDGSNGEVMVTNGSGKLSWGSPTASDYGRSGVASDLYEGTTKLTDKYVNEGQADAITTGMIKDGEVGNGDLGDLSVGTSKLQDAAVTNAKLAPDAVTTDKISDGTIVDADVSATANISASKINDGAGSGLDADLLDGMQSGNGSGNIPISNGTLNTNLNSDMLDGKHASDFFGSGDDWGRSGVASDLYEGTTTLTDKYVNEGQANAITTGMIKDLEVNTSDIADTAVTTAKIRDRSINANKLQNDCVTTWKIINGAILNVDISDTAKIAPSKILGIAWTGLNDGAGTGLDADLLDGLQSGNALGNVPISNGILSNNLNSDMLDGKHASDFFGSGDDWGRSGVASDLYEGTTMLTDKYVNEGQADAIMTGMIKDGEVGTNDIADGAVTTGKIADGTIVDADVSASAAIDPSKIKDTAWTSGNDGSTSGLDADLLDGMQSGNASGDIPISNGTLNTDLNADMLDGQHASNFMDTLSDWGRSGVATDLYEGTMKLADRYVDEGQANSITTGMIKDLEVGTLDLADSSVTSVKIARNAVTSAKIADNTIVNADVSGAAQIDPTKIQGTAWTSFNDGSASGLDADLLDGKHASAFLLTTNDYGRKGVAADLYENDSTLTERYLNNGEPNCITTGMIKDGEVGELDLANGAVTEPKLGADAVTTGKIKDGEVGTFDLADLSVTTGKLADDAVTTGKILDGTILRADVDEKFKAPYADTADYALAAPNDNDWTISGSNMYSAVSGNVGIGVTSPGAKLEVAGDVKTKGDIYIDSDQNSDADFLYFGSASGYGISAIRHTASTNQFDFFTSGNGFVRLRLNGDSYLDTGGNIGIGKTSPGQKLDVAGTVQMTGFKMPTGATNGWVLTSDALGTGTWQQPAAGVNGSGNANYIPKFVGTTTLGNSVMYENAGKIGVGTSTAGSKLEVSGDLRVTDKANIGPGCTNTGVNAFAAGYYNNSNGDYSTTPGGHYNIANSIYTTVAGGSDNRADSVCAFVGGGLQNLAVNVYATVGGGMNDTASGQWSTIGGGWENLASGYASTVGGGKLNVASGFSAEVGGGLSNVASGQYATVAGGYADTASADYSFAAGQQVRVGSAATNTFAFGRNFTTSTANAVVFHNTVNEIKVGIGTTAPARPLHVKDVLRLEPRSTAPSSPSEGDMYMNSTTHKLMVYDGTVWQACW